MRNFRLGTSATFAIAAGCAVMVAVAPATVRADEPEPGSTCDSGQLNLSTRSSAGEGLRCLADSARGYIWQDDDGTTQTPDDAARIARDACSKLPHHSNRSDCRSLLDGFTRN